MSLKQPRFPCGLPFKPTQIMGSGTLPPTKWLPFHTHQIVKLPVERPQHKLAQESPTFFYFWGSGKSAKDIPNGSGVPEPVFGLPHGAESHSRLRPQDVWAHGHRLFVGPCRDPTRLPAIPGGRGDDRRGEAGRLRATVVRTPSLREGYFLGSVSLLLFSFSFYFFFWGGGFVSLILSPGFGSIVT